MGYEQGWIYIYIYIRKIKIFLLEEKKINKS